MTNVVTIAFQGDTLFAVEDTNVVGVAITPICRDLGVSPQKQRHRIMQDPILSKGATMMVSPSIGGPQETLCLRLDLVAGWLFGIDENRCKPEVRPKVRAYREQCFQVLHEHFFARKGDALPPPQSLPDEKALTWPEKCRIVEMYQKMSGARAAAEKALSLGFESVPALDAQLRQAEFKFIIDLNTSAPTTSDGVH